MAVTVSAVVPDSLAAGKRITVGDRLLTVNRQPIADVLDYRFHLQNKRLRLEMETAGGKHRIVHLHKQEYEDIGLEFATYLMDEQHACRNQCIFCFIDQLPPGMRKSLYFKDDDSRLSFLFGNYITLTNLSEHEIERIIHMHISPINISVHTTNPALRCQMMHNRFAGESLDILRRFAKAGLQINCQLVLCPGYNDAEELQRTMEDLAALYPAVTSVAAVPVGLTRFRDGLEPLRPFTKAESMDTLDRMEKMGEKMLQTYGTRLFYPSDEWYIIAQRPIPDAAFYEEFSQIENGVGMLSLLMTEFREALAATDAQPKGSRLLIATGVAAAPFLQQLANEAKARWGDAVHIEVQPIINRFFGENITVAGLLTGRDLVEQLQGKTADYLLLTENMLRQQGDCFLDDMTPEEITEQVHIPIRFTTDSGEDLVNAFLL